MIGHSDQNKEHILEVYLYFIMTDKITWLEQFLTKLVRYKDIYFYVFDFPHLFIVSKDPNFLYTTDFSV